MTWTRKVRFGRGRPPGTKNPRMADHRGLRPRTGGLYGRGGLACKLV